MKELTSYNRVAGYLNKVFDLLNAEFFENALSRPTITIQSTPRAYGHFSLREDTWVSKLGGTHEINIGAGTLARPIEEVTATLLHEMVHYYNYENGITSRVWNFMEFTVWIFPSGRQFTSSVEEILLPSKSSMIRWFCSRKSARWSWSCSRRFAKF